MDLKVQKRLAAQVAGCGTKRIVFRVDRLKDIKEAITRADIYSLIKQDAIHVLPIRGVSRGRAKAATIQRSKGRRKGPGSRKGKPTARLSRKTRWIQKIRLQRRILSKLKDAQTISTHDYRILYRKSKGGVFRSLHHMMLYIEENKMRKK